MYTLVIILFTEDSVVDRMDYVLTTMGHMFSQKRPVLCIYIYVKC